MNSVAVPILTGVPGKGVPELLGRPLCCRMGRNPEVKDADELFAQQPAHEKRKLLDYVIEGCSWKNGQLTPEWRVPWYEMVQQAA